MHALNRDVERTSAIFAHLREHRESSTKEIAYALKADRRVTKMALQRLKKSGQLVSVGWARGAKWALPGKSPAKEGPSR